MGKIFQATPAYRKGLVGEEIILTENTTEKMRYVFSDIRASSFLWRKERMGGSNEWKTVAKVTAEKR